MRIARLNDGASVAEPTVVCLGFFDGVHIGHAQLVKRARDVARAAGLLVCVHTFDVMPASVLQPQSRALELTPLARKAELLAALGVDILAVSAFEDTMQMRAKAFFDDILLHRLHARHIVAGFHHHFGHQGEGDVDMLRMLCAMSGVGLDIIDAVTLPDGELVSSTAIREALRRGEPERAAVMLGRTVEDMKGEAP